MKKIIKVLLVIILSIVLLLVIGISFVLIEDYVEANLFNIIIQNTLDQEIYLSINNNIIHVPCRTELWDRIFIRRNDRIIVGAFTQVFTYRLVINRENILEREVLFPSEEIGSFSARGGIFTNIIIVKNNDESYEMHISRDFEKRSNESLDFLRRRRFTDIFNTDGLNTL